MCASKAEATMCASKAIVTLVSASILLAGCGHSLTSPRSTNPLMKDRIGVTKSGEMYALTSRADRRSVLVLGPSKVCSEPPPDVAEAVLSESAAKAGVDDQGSAEIDSSLQTAVMQLNRRSQGLEIYRIGLFANCLLFQSGKLSEEQYSKEMDKVLAAAKELTLAEIEHLPEISKAILSVNKQPDGESEPSEAD